MISASIISFILSNIYQFAFFNENTKYQYSFNLFDIWVLEFDIFRDQIYVHQNIVI